MPELADRLGCTGCGACADACVAGAISMREDADGFPMPSVDASKCVSCGRCTKVCPVMNPVSRGTAPDFFAARLKDRALSGEVSSGGAFWALARVTIENGGIVYGAVQESPGKIRHRRAETLDEVSRMRRSKYLPSDVSGCYRLVRSDLEKGRRVLFSGTGCQVAGLRGFLGDDHSGLVTCEVVCHGIPSLKVWRAFVESKERSAGKRILDVIFRDKSAGWKNNRYRTVFEDGSEELEASATHPFHSAYLKGMISRNSCASCPFARVPRVADITLADFWKYAGPLSELSDGVSLVIVNTDDGRRMLDDAVRYLELEPTSETVARSSCRHLFSPPSVSPLRDRFLAETGRCDYLGMAKAFATMKPPKPLYRRALGKLKRMLKTLLGIEARRRSRQRAERERKTELRLGAMEDAFLLLAKKGIPVWYVNRVGLRKDPGWRYSDSAERRRSLGLSFPKMLEDVAANERDLRELFGARYSPEYVREIGRIPQIVETGGYCRHEDRRGKLVNVVGGLRVTVGCPKDAVRTLHVYGRCGVFGYAVEDADTLPSQLQRELIAAGMGDVKVVNHGLWGADDARVDANFMHDAVGFGSGDAVLFYRKHMKSEIHERWNACGVRYLDITAAWHAYPESAWCFYDRPGHMNAVGYGLVARILAAEMKSHDLKSLPVTEERLSGLVTPRLTEFLKGVQGGRFETEFTAYVEKVTSGIPPLPPGSRCGAIVMNCNPFTCGHRRLIETAASQVDRLFILVVEEDRSFFRFADRFEMVKRGTVDLPNVVVIPSGRFVISSLTFPEYFMKDYVKSRDFDVSGDVRTFGERVAPALGITVRFAGAEPFDPVTANYNRTMAEILPRYGVEFREIPRFAADDGKLISATEVRRLIEKGDADGVKRFVPDSTFAVLSAGYLTKGASL